MPILNIFNRHEQLARKHLKKKGLTLIGKNYLCQYGEIDLIMSDQEYLIFIEVRYRQRQDYGSALESVTISKQNKIIRSAQYFLITHLQWQNHPIRFDIVAIDKKQLNWVKNAF